MADFACAASSTVKSGKSNLDLAEQRCNQMVSVIFQLTNQAAASAIGAPSGMAPGLRSNDLLLKSCQQ